MINGSSLQKNPNIDTLNSDKKSLMRVSMLQTNNPITVNSKNSNYIGLSSEINQNLQNNLQIKNRILREN